MSLQNYENHRGGRISAFAGSCNLTNLAIGAIANVAVLLGYLLSPSGRAQPEPPQFGHQNTTQSVSSSIAAENVFYGQVTSIKETPFSNFTPYDVAMMTGQNPILLSPVVADRPQSIVLAEPTATPPGSFILLDTFTGRTVTFTGNIPHTHMGDGFTNNSLPGTATYISIRSFTLYLYATAVANYTDVHARLALWNNYVATTSPVFANYAAFFDIDLGPLSVTSAPTFYAVDMTIMPPYPFLYGPAGTAWGYSLNFQGSTTGGALADDTNLTSTICYGAPNASGQILTGTSPNFGYYRNASGETDFNFQSTDVRSLGGLASQSVGILIRGDPGTGPTPIPGPTPTPGPTLTPSPSPTVSPGPTASMTPPPTVCTLNEGMDNVSNLVVPKGWTMTNHSSIPGTTSWFQGSTAVFPAVSGAGDSYIAANYNNDGGPSTDTISNWLLTPPVTLQNGGNLTFWTRTVDQPFFPDRLQIRYSTNGNSSNVGTSPTDVGDFAHLVLDINPTLTTSGYPNTWTQYSVTLSGLGLPVKGRLAFRYFVQNAGPNGNNADYIGIDSVSFVCSAPPCCGSPSPTRTPSPTLTPTPTPQPTGTPSPTCQPVITLSSSQTVVTGNSVSCNNGVGHTDNSYWRAFNMNGFTAGAAYNVTSISFGIEEASTGHVGAGTPTPTPGGTGAQPVTVRLYTNAGGAFPAGTRTQIAATTVNVPNQTGTIVTTPLVVTVPANTSELIMELFTPNGETAGNLFFLGSNTAQQGGPSYISAIECGINTPLDLAQIEFPNVHFIMNVNGSCFFPGLSISGNVSNCSSPAPTATPPASPTPPQPVPVPNVLMILSGAVSGTTMTDSSGNYAFSNLGGGGTYTIAPSKSALAPGSSEINSIDVLAIQRHFLGITAIPSGCRLSAADAVINGTINNVDVIAVQRFFLGVTSGSGSTGQYQFVPANRTYPSLGASQSNQNYSMYVVGDVAAQFANRGDPAP